MIKFTAEQKLKMVMENHLQVTLSDFVEAQNAVQLDDHEGFRAINEKISFAKASMDVYAHEGGEADDTTKCLDIKTKLLSQQKD